MVLLPSLAVLKSDNKEALVRRVALALLCALVLPVSTAQAWTWPVDGPVLRPFVFDHASPYAAGQHRGIDIGASAGARVLAPAEGIVSFAGTVPMGGKTISIETASGYTATLLHLGSIDVKRGAVVHEGGVVGAAGAEPISPAISAMGSTNLMAGDGTCGGSSAAGAVAVA